MRLVVVLLLLLAACAPQPVPAPPVVQEVSGVVQGELSLSGDVLLVGDLLVPHGSRLVITAGTRITVQPTDATKIDPEFLSSQIELLVRGSLQIDGTESAPVIFRPAGQGDSGDPQWAGIILDGVTDSSLRYLQVHGADTGLLLVATDAFITEALITGCRYGLVVQGGSPQIYNSQISGGEGGVFVWNGAQPLLDNLLVADNAEEGLSIDRSSQPQLISGRLERNAIGLVAATSVSVETLQFSANHETIRRLLPVAGVQP
jgi:hypothetical protein